MNSLQLVCCVSGLLAWSGLLFTDTSLSTIKLKHAAVASAHPLATRAGVQVLKAGGNAFDAAVAVSATLAVVEPYSSGLGGGGFWLLYHKRNNKVTMLDGREKAPGLAHRKLYLDASGKIVPGKSINGTLAAAIPGEPAALAYLSKKYGRLPLARSLRPAISAAEKGFKADAIFVRLAGFRLQALNASTDAAAVFLRNKQVPAIGTLIVQNDLANTLRLLAAKGHAGFYSGQIARALVEAVSKTGGIWTLADLKNYKVVERPAIKFKYRDMTIYSASPPSSGGVALAQILNMLELQDLKKMNSANRIHYTVEAMRRAYRDRAEYLGDPEFTRVPVEKLIAKQYARVLSQSVTKNKATPSSALAPVAVSGKKARHTTHFSVIDFQGNRVAATLSINYPFGSGYVATGTGVLLNDEMDDFSSKPGTANVYGLVGGQANSIEAGKRPLSSMSPTFAETGQKLLLTGTPGGSRIITMVLHSLINFSNGANAAQIVKAHRYHHQYLPDLIQYEPGAFTASEIKALTQKGHQLKALKSRYGNMQVIIVDKKTGKLDAASDPRGVGEAKVISR